MTVVINIKKCPAQENICLAIPSCPNGAITYQKDSSIKLGGKIWIDNVKCNNCGACIGACCGNAIELK